MITFDDITVVVQGPVQTFKDREQEPSITEKCLRSVREYLPGAKIILSTWPGQNLNGLDFDQLVICQDPGQNCRNYNLNGEPQYYNNNRQIVSSRDGLRAVETPYAMKLRSDNFLTSNAFVELQKQFDKRHAEYKFLKERVVVSDVFTRKYAKGFPVAFHISDFFYFGRTEDVLSLWDIPLFKDFIPTKEVPFNIGFPDFAMDCTQALFLAAMQSFDPTITLTSMLDNSGDKIHQSELCIANNLVIASLEQIGLGLCQKFLGTARVSRTKGKVAHYQFLEWLELYQRYCDPSADLTPYEAEKRALFFNRCRYIFPYRVETKVKLWKRAHMKGLR